MKITKADLDENNCYKKSDNIETDEAIEIDKNLGCVKIKKSVITKKYLLTKGGTGIRAGEGDLK